MKKRHLLLFLTVCLATVLGCGTTPKAATKKIKDVPFPTEPSSVASYTRTGDTITLNLGFSTNDSDPRAIASQHFKELVETGTNGTIRVNIYPDGALGNDSQLISGVVHSKEVDMTVSSAGNFARYASKASVSALPYLFTDFESAWEFIDSDLMNEINEEFLEYNIHVLSYFDNGFRCVTTSASAGPIQTVSDMKGLNIRTPENDMVMETISVLGANPKFLDFTKVYDALKNGTFDAQENPIPVIYNSKLYEVQSYLAITNHSYDAMPFVIREDIWQAMTAEEQKIVENAAKEASSLNRRLVKEQTETYVSLLENSGMVITYPDLTAFQEKTSGVLNFFAPVYGQNLVNALSRMKTTTSASSVSGSTAQATPETPAD